MEDSERDVMEYYFCLGYPNEITLEFLEHFHGIKISLRTLKRRLEYFHGIKISLRTLKRRLEHFHGIKISLRTLKRRLPLFGLGRRGK